MYIIIFFSYGILFRNEKRAFTSNAILTTDDTYAHIYIKDAALKFEKYCTSSIIYVNINILVLKWS